MHPSSFYAIKAGQQLGPMTLREFAEGWLKGAFDENTQIWHKGMGADWGWPDEWLVNTKDRAEKNRKYFEARSTRALVWEFPCWELLRTAEYDFLPRDWHQRWEECGGRFYGEKERMIARKADPIWQELGNPERYEDALGLPYPPFVLGTSMMVREIVREEAIELGMIEKTSSAEDEYREKMRRKRQ